MLQLAQVCLQLYGEIARKLPKWGRDGTREQRNQSVIASTQSNQGKGMEGSRVPMDLPLGPSSWCVRTGILRMPHVSIADTGMETGNAQRLLTTSLQGPDRKQRWPLGNSGRGSKQTTANLLGRIFLFQPPGRGYSPSALRALAICLVPVTLSGLCWIIRDPATL